MINPEELEYFGKIFNQVEQLHSLKKIDIRVQYNFAQKPVTSIGKGSSAKDYYWQAYRKVVINELDWTFWTTKLKTWTTSPQAIQVVVQCSNKSSIIHWE